MTDDALDVLREIRDELRALRLGYGHASRAVADESMGTLLDVIGSAACATVWKLRAGRLPSTMEYAALLREAGYTPDEARGLVVAYDKAIAGRSSAEDEFMASLRAFGLG